jgi:hypothetical protein
MSPSSRKVLHRDGNFRVAVALGGQVVLEHRCNKRQPLYRNSDENYHWEAHMWSAESRGEPCQWCGWRAADGLQATFWFLYDGERH